MIPESEYFDAFFCQAPAARFILLDPFGNTMLKAVELDGEFSAGAIKIQNVITNHVLPPKFEPGELSSSQLAPKLLFFLRLSASKSTGNFL